MSRARVAAVAGLLAAGGVVAARQLHNRWGGADDPCAEDDYLLPAGASLTVLTDDGAELAATVAGDGPTVVLSHCWTGSREMWAPVAHRLLRDGRRVVLYDQRGHGSSTVGSEGFTIPRLGADLRAVLEAIDGRDAVLAGHSMGGMSIQSMAIHHPEVVDERVRALVLVATSAGGLRAPARGAALIGGRTVTRALRSPLGPILVRGTVGRAAPRAHLELTRGLFVDCAGPTRAGWLQAILTMDLRRDVASISVPTTVVVGSRDRMTPPRLAAHLASTIPGARLVTLEGFGHQLPIEAPDEIARLIAAA